MTPELVLATTNPGKLHEVRSMLRNIWEVRGADDLDSPPVVQEDQETFAGNALKKARAFATFGYWALADDSGLCVDALDGRPGVHSARYAVDDQARNERLLAELAGIPAPRRSARFVCALALVSPGGEEHYLAEGVIAGTIAAAPRGEGGFGFDPIFLLPSGQSFAEVTPLEKNRISHRGRALRMLLPRLEAIAATQTASPGRAFLIHPAADA